MTSTDWPLNVRRCRPALGTYIEISVASDGLHAAADVGGAIDNAFAAVDRVDRRMSFHRMDSDLSRINAAAVGAFVCVDTWTVEVLRLARELHLATGGDFDCGVGGVLRDGGLLPLHADAAAMDENRGGSVLDIEPVAASQVRKIKPVCLDLGGIAKGFAVDRAVEALATAGMRCAVVNAGGDLRVLGTVSRAIHVRWPWRPAAVVHLGDLADGAAATSAGYFAEENAPGTGAPACWPLVDPLTGKAVSDPRSFTVVASLCAVADGLTKALAVCGQLPQSCLRRYGARTIVL